MELPVVTTAGKKGTAVAASDALWAAKPRRDLVFQVATSQMSNRRQVLAHTKTRWGLASMCIGVGQGIAVVLERS